MGYGGVEGVGKEIRPTFCHLVLQLLDRRLTLLFADI